MTEQDAVERVAKAIHAVEWEDTDFGWEKHTEEAAAAITAYNAYLRERVYAPEVAAAGAKYFMDNPAEVKLLALAVIAGEMDKASVSREVLHYTVVDIVENALDAMIGKEHADDRG